MDASTRIFLFVGCRGTNSVASMLKHSTHTYRSVASGFLRVQERELSCGAERECFMRGAPHGTHDTLVRLGAIGSRSIPASETRIRSDREITDPIASSPTSLNCNVCPGRRTPGARSAPGRGPTMN
eukprot:3067650-Prymnesium_polylepis.1